MERWHSREEEVIGWTGYLTSLVNWCSLGSIQFGREIEQASRWPSPIVWRTLSKDQQTRAIRLCSILKLAFSNHARISMMISGFMEGLDIIPGTSAGDVFGNATTYLGNGFELVRQLTKEYSLRSRGECLSLRTQLLSRTFASTASDGAVSDIVRQIDVACAKYMRLMSTVSGTEDLSGLRVEDADMLGLLIRSLPSNVRDYALMQDLDGKGLKRTRCGKKGHEVSACTMDLAKTKCYKCGVFGHVSVNCRSGASGKTGEKPSSSSSTSNPGKGHGGSPVGKSTSYRSGGSKGSGSAPKGFSKTKGGKGSSKGGKKGKMFVVCDDDGTWTWTESEEVENVAVEDDACRETVEDMDEKVLVLSSLLPWVDSWSDSDAVHGTAEDELEHEHGLVLLAVPCDEACCSAEHIDLACEHDCMSCMNLLSEDEIPRRMSEVSSLGSLSGSLCKFSGDSHLLASRGLEELIDDDDDDKFEMSPIRVEEKGDLSWEIERLYDAAGGDSHQCHDRVTVLDHDDSCVQSEGTSRVSMLLSQVFGSGVNEDFWLLDSGASVNVRQCLSFAIPPSNL